METSFTIVQKNQKSKYPFFSSALSRNFVSGTVVKIKFHSFTEEKNARFIIFLFVLPYTSFENIFEGKKISNKIHFFPHEIEKNGTRTPYLSKEVHK